MNTAVTSGVEVTVKSQFEPGFSRPLDDYFFYSYTIQIKNNNDFPVQLLRRHWTIVDDTGHVKEVEGPGVVGVQPILKPSETHEYSSGCELPTLKGIMKGTYLMMRLSDEETFRARIPEFKLRVPYKLN